MPHRYFLPHRRSSRRQTHDWSALDRRTRDVFGEFLLASALLAVLVSLAFSNASPALDKARFTEALTLPSTVTTVLHVERAVRGAFPADMSVEDGNIGRFVDTIVWQPPEIVVIERADDRGDAARIGFRPAINTHTGAVVWLCGYRQAPQGFVAGEPTATTVRADRLPFMCRSSAR